jgi:hypothetical protein
MGKVTHRGWLTSYDDIPQPTGIIMGRNLRSRATPEDDVVAGPAAGADASERAGLPDIGRGDRSPWGSPARRWTMLYVLPGNNDGARRDEHTC